VIFSDLWTTLLSENRILTLSPPLNLYLKSKGNNCPDEEAPNAGYA